MRNWQPSYGKIDEEQHFMLELNGPATLESVRENVWCRPTASASASRSSSSRASSAPPCSRPSAATRRPRRTPLRFVTLQCNRTLTPGGRVQLVYGKGVATPSGVVNNVERRLNFQVREPFAVSFSCERENAQSACLPLKPMVLQFNAPVARKLAAQITLKGGGKTFKPKFDDENARTTMRWSTR